MDNDMKQADNLTFAQGGVVQKTRVVSLVKLNWNGSRGDSWCLFNQQLLGWGWQAGLCYRFNIIFRLEYYDNGYNAIFKHIREFTTHMLFNHDLKHRYGALQMACASAPHILDLFILHAVRQNASHDLTPAYGLS
jgi:hypothetical protein